MGAQANRLTGCSLHPGSLAPEGGAPAQADVSCIAVGRGEPETAAQAARTTSKVRECFSPWERCTTEPANTILLARCKVSTEVVCLMGEKTAMPPGFWLKPRKSASPLPLKRRGLRRDPSVSADGISHLEQVVRVLGRVR